VSVVWLYDLIELKSKIQPCKQSEVCWTQNMENLNTQVTATAVYVAWFAVARLAIFLVPGVSALATRARSAQQPDNFYKIYFGSVLLRDGPHYVLLAGSAWLFLKLLALDAEATLATVMDVSPHSQLIEAFKTYAIVTCALSVLSFMLAASHNTYIDALHSPARVRGGRERHNSRAAPTGTLARLKTQPYDLALFGDEEGKTYPAECAICLGSWEPADLIKVTPCGHAFHQNCIARWLSTARTCALCRTDLAAAPGANADVAQAEGAAEP
jgi:hypothetical protein